MGKGWKLVARIGGTGEKYPHLLVDLHGWCLRLGPKREKDDKYYASLPMALRGLVEHFTRRRLGNLSAVLDLKGLAQEVEDALHSALSMCREAAKEGGKGADVRPVAGPEARLGGPDAPRTAPVPPTRMRAG